MGRVLLRGDNSMGGSTENRAYETPEQVEKRDVAISLPTAQRMLSLVRRIVTDLLQYQRQLEKLMPELDSLDRNRRDLSWPERARRYHVQEEVETANHYVQDAMAELEVLGVELI